MTTERRRRMNNGLSKSVICWEMMHNAANNESNIDADGEEEEVGAMMPIMPPITLVQEEEAPLSCMGASTMPPIWCQ